MLGQFPIIDAVENFLHKEVTNNYVLLMIDGSDAPGYTAAEEAFSSLIDRYGAIVPEKAYKNLSSYARAIAGKVAIEVEELAL